MRRYQSNTRRVAAVLISVAAANVFAQSTTSIEPPLAPSASTSLPAAVAPSTRPAVASAVKSPATRPSPEVLLDQAVAFMRQNQHQKARPLLDQIGEIIPAPDRNRPVVLNRAITDVTLKANAMRAVREMNDYLKVHRGADELATNILGAALNITGRNQKLKDGALWQAALKEWDRRNYLLDHARPGYHRWGAKWITEDQYVDLQDRQKSQSEMIKERQDLADRASWRVGAAQQRRDICLADREYARNAIADDYNLTDAARARGRQRAGQPNAPLGGVNVTDRRIFEQGRDSGAAQANVALQRAEEELRSAMTEETALRRELAQLQSRQSKPEWPATFDAVDPSEVNAPALPPPDPKAAAAMKDEQTLRGWPEPDKAVPRDNPPAGVRGTTTQPTLPVGQPATAAPEPSVSSSPAAVATPSAQEQSPFDQSGQLGAKPRAASQPVR